MKAVCRMLFILPILPFILVYICLISFAVFYDYIMDNNDKMENWVKDTYSKIFLPYLRWIDDNFRKQKGNKK